MEALLTQTWDMLIGREHGPLAFRLVIQPLVAVLLAVRAGVRDAQAGRPPYGSAVIAGQLSRRALLREGWHDVARLFFMAVLIDIIYQIIVFRWIYPGQAVIVALVVSFPSYVLCRGPADRLARYWLRTSK